MKEVIERLNWLAYKCEDKAITPDVKDDVKYALEEIERLNKQIEEYQKALDETTSEKIDLENIIKEVREYIEENSKSYSLPGVIKDMRYVDFYKLLEILDKVKE